MKKLLKVIFIIILLLFNREVLALSLDNTDINIVAGSSENLMLYADLPEGTTKVEFTLVFDSYDIPVYFEVADNLVDENPNGVKHIVVLSEASSGKTLLGTVTVRSVNSPSVKTAGAQMHTAKAFDINGVERILNNSSLNVKIVSEEEKQNENNETEKNIKFLKNIESKIVEIKFKEDKYEYEVSVSDNIEELDLKAVTFDDSSKVEISSQKIKELDDGKILITVTNSGKKQVYTIKVKVEKDKPLVQADESEFEGKGYAKEWIMVMVVLSVVLVFGMGLTSKKK